jgi:RimJ/RimL family protein N-acetyltransferase
MAPVGGPVLLDDEQAARWFERMVDPGRPTDCYRLILDGQGRPVGEISYHRFDPGTGTAGLNVKVAHTERGRGYGTEALRQFLEMYFRDESHHCITDDIAPENEGGQKLLLEFGFEHDPSVKEVFFVYLTRERYEALCRERQRSKAAPQ